jgi:hypothetical protein
MKIEGYWVAMCVAGQLLLAQNADTTLTKDQVLDRWAAALGGRDKLEQIRTIHARGFVETGGMKGTFER